MFAECCHLCITLTFCMHCMQIAAGNVNWGFSIFSLLCLPCGAVWFKLPLSPRLLPEPCSLSTSCCYSTHTLNRSPSKLSHCMQDAASNVNWGFITSASCAWHAAQSGSDCQCHSESCHLCSSLTLYCCCMQDAAGNVNWGFIIFSLLCLACGAVWLRLLHAWCALGRTCLSCPRAQCQVTLPGSPHQCLTKLTKTHRGWWILPNPPHQCLRNSSKPLGFGVMLMQKLGSGVGTIVSLSYACI